MLSKKTKKKIITFTASLVSKALGNIWHPVMCKHIGCIVSSESKSIVYNSHKLKECIACGAAFAMICDEGPYAHLGKSIIINRPAKNQTPEEALECYKESIYSPKNDPKNKFIDVGQRYEKIGDVPEGKMKNIEITHILSDRVIVDIYDDKEKKVSSGQVWKDYLSSNYRYVGKMVTTFERKLLTEEEVMARYQHELSLRDPKDIPVEEPLKDTNGNPITVTFGDGIKREISVIKVNQETRPAYSKWTFGCKPTITGKHKE